MVLRNPEGTLPPEADLTDDPARDNQLALLKDIFDNAISLPTWERQAFIHEASGGDTWLETELSSLLAAHDSSHGYFERLAHELVGPGLAAAGFDVALDEVPAEQKVSHYEIIARIGVGGMGVVYKARDTQLGRTVALKFLPSHHASNPAARARLLAEARAASRLDHPNIGTVYEIAEGEDGKQFIAMAWYDGETLKERIQRERITVPDAIAIASQIGSALSAAHAAGIVHRDIKPANVIVTRSGTAKLLDFGIAKFVSDEDGERHTAAGTLPYMSPEQTRDAIVDARTDIWSLGVLLYEALAGQRPFRGVTDQQIVSQIRNERPVPLSSLRSDISAGVERIVERCLEKDPANRFQSADDFCSALHANNEGDTAPEIVQRRVPRWTVLLAAAIVVAIAVGTLSYSIRGTATQNPSTSAPRRVVVFPFVDSVTAGDAAYIAEGLSDDIRSSISRMGQASVATYLSSLSYLAASRAPTQLAAEMNVDALLEGVVRGSSVAPNVEIRLIDVRTGRIEWTQAFRYGSNGFSEAPERVIAAVAASLRIDHPVLHPEHNARAYDLYLHGRYEELSATPRTIFGRISVDKMRRAQALYAQARAIDPDFAQARAKLAASHMFAAMTYDTSRARVDQARVEAEAALRLDPLISEPHEVLSGYWSRIGNSQKAIEEIETGLKNTPHHVGLRMMLGAQMFEAGRFEDAISQFEQAGRLDRRNPVAVWRIASAFGRMRRNAEGMKAFDRLIEISPNDHEMKLIQGQSYLRWKGSTEKLHAAVSRIPRDWDVRGMATFARYTALRVDRRYRDALAMLDSSKTAISTDGLVYYPKALMRAELYEGLGDLRDARLQYEMAAQLLEDSAAAHPGDGSVHAALGLAYAGLNRRREAIAESERAMNLTKLSRNAGYATAYMGLAIEVFGRVGERDRAFEMIELLLTLPAGREITIPFLRVWPGYDSLTNDPRFDALLKRFATS